MFIFSKIGSYFLGVLTQAKRVRWPFGKTLFYAVLVTIIFAALFALFLSISNQLIYWMLQALGMNS